MADIYRTIQIDNKGEVIAVLDEERNPIEGHDISTRDPDDDTLATYEFTAKGCVYTKNGCYCT